MTVSRLFAVGPARRVLARTAVAISFLVLHASCSDGGRSAALMPWEIERLDSGSTRVFGVELGVDTLVEAAKMLGPRYELALFGRREEVPTLEAYYKEITLGGLSARVVLSLALTESDRERLRHNSLEDRVLAEGEERRWTIASEDLPVAKTARVVGISYIPLVQIDEDTARTRFGEPDEIVRVDDGTQHWLYAAKGLDLTLDPDGRELLQYVHPAHFERLRGPLGKH